VIIIQNKSFTRYFDEDIFIQFYIKRNNFAEKHNILSYETNKDKINLIN
jgi:hypothetical protein